MSAAVVTQTVSFSAVFDDTLEDVGGFIDRRVGATDVLKNRRARGLVKALEHVIVGEELKVDGELEFSANSGNTAGDVSTVNGASIPSICGNGDGGTDALKGATIVGGNGNSFVQVAEKTLDTNSLVVAPGNWVEGDLKDIAHGSEGSLKSATGINHNETTQANLEQNILEEQDGKGVSSDGGGFKAYDELS